ncbi:unnamed protein product [Clavelina lepadiformis]|uniref:Uncharacterized protein n=1 Tax=Clavelina lepadiformis TaxID=159417 RepID=A0ABP0GMP4_CLALP
MTSRIFVLMLSATFLALAASTGEETTHHLTCTRPAPIGMDDCGERFATVWYYTGSKCVSVKTNYCVEQPETLFWSKKQCENFCHKK